MSLVLALIDTASREPDARLAHAMLASQAWRAPDGCAVRVDGAAVLARASLRSVDTATVGGALETLGHLHLSGDVRLDGRNDLARTLSACGARFPVDASDEALVLQAIALWGDAALDRISGDFAIVVWDSLRHRLLAARDHYGVAQLYYGWAGTILVVCNSLTCLLTCPGIDMALDHDTIADFLLLNAKSRSDATSYRHVRRVPPAHVLIQDGAGLKIRPYWTPQPDGLPEVRWHAQDYVEAFRHHFDQAIADRLRWPRCGTTLSGGMDSGSITACLAMLAGPDKVRAYTSEASRIIDDKEGHYARQVAAAYGLNHEILAADQCYIEAPTGLWPGLSLPHLPPEPTDALGTIPAHHIYRSAATYAPVMFCGFGGDPLFGREDGTAPSSTAKERALRYPHTAWCWGMTGLRPAIRQRRVHRASGAAAGRHFVRHVTVPAWLSPDFAVEQSASERLSMWLDQRGINGRIGMARAPVWADTFQQADPDFTGQPLKVRQPFFDRRLIQFMQTVPTLPWLPRKMLMRAAMAGRLPDAVLRRPKTPLPDDPGREAVRRWGVQPWMDTLLDTEGLDAFINVPAARQHLHDVNNWEFFSYIRFRQLWCLAYWLKHRQQNDIKLPRRLG